MLPITLDFRIFNAMQNDQEKQMKPNSIEIGLDYVLQTVALT